MRTTFGEKGYLRATQVFSVEQYVKSFEELFNQMTTK